MPKKIVSAGLICLDITPVFDDAQNKNLENLLAPGKLIEVNNVDVHTGGSVSNSGLAFRFFGANTSFLGKIGNDYFGDIVMKIFSKYNAADNLIVSADSNTSYSVVLAPPGIDRIFFHHPGANNTFCYDDLDFESIRNADLFHFGYPTIMKKLYENKGAELIRIFKKVKSLEVLTSLDMSAVDPESDSGKADWESIVKEVIPYVDFFVPSVEELCFLIDKPRYAEWLNQAGNKDITTILDLEHDIKPLAEKLLSWGAKVILIKCGAPGMYLRTADSSLLSSMGDLYSSWTNLDIFERSYKSECYASGTGAGDVSLAAFLSAAIDGYTSARCLQLATGAGACCVTTFDAFSGLISFEDMIKKIDSGWEKI